VYTCECFKSYEILVNWYPVVFEGSNVMFGPRPANELLCKSSDTASLIKKNTKMNGQAKHWFHLLVLLSYLILYFIWEKKSKLLSSTIAKVCVNP